MDIKETTQKIYAFSFKIEQSEFNFTVNAASQEEAVKKLTDNLGQCIAELSKINKGK